MDWIQQWQSKLNKQNEVAPLVRTGGSRHTGLAALPYRNIHFDSLDMLIEEAKQAQIQCDYIAPLKKPFKTLGAIIIPIVAFVAQKIGNAASQDEMITMALQVIVLVLLTFSLIFSLTPIIKDILYRDYNKYDDFIYDLRQIKLFYAKKNATYSNPI
ncbi:MAG: hypothetical protein ACLU3U_07275 [Gallintestinimicrobium sp.]